MSNSDKSAQQQRSGHGARPSKFAYVMGIIYAKYSKIINYVINNITCKRHLSWEYLTEITMEFSGCCSPIAQCTHGCLLEAIYHYYRYDMQDDEDSDQASVFSLEVYHYHRDDMQDDEDNDQVSVFSLEVYHSTTTTEMICRMMKKVTRPVLKSTTTTEMICRTMKIMIRSVSSAWTTVPLPQR